MITATEDLLSAMMDDSDEEESIPLCLVSLEDKSLGLGFASLQMAAAMVLWQEFAAVINTGNFEKLVPKARQSLVEIVSFVKKKECTVFVEDSERGVMASFDYNITLPAELKFHGGSSLIGEVVRVGGADPKVRLKLPSGKFLSCDTTESIAKELGHRLYETVTCKGNATWDYTTGEVLRFRIEHVGTFKKVSASKAFENLAAAMETVIPNLMQSHNPSPPE